MITIGLYTLMCLVVECHATAIVPPLPLVIASNTRTNLKPELHVRTAWLYGPGGMYMRAPQFDGSAFGLYQRRRSPFDAEFAALVLEQRQSAFDEFCGSLGQGVTRNPLRLSRCVLQVKHVFDQARPGSYPDSLQTAFALAK